jgi:hypothetical protein
VPSAWAPGLVAPGADVAVPAVAAVIAGRTPACSGVAHSEQNFAPGGLTVPHVGQPAASADPHSMQNFAPARFSVPQVEQIKRIPSAAMGSPVRGAAETMSIGAY